MDTSNPGIAQLTFQYTKNLLEYRFPAFSIFLYSFRLYLYSLSVILYCKAGAQLLVSHSSCYI